MRAEVLSGFLAALLVMSCRKQETPGSSPAARKKVRCAAAAAATVADSVELRGTISPLPDRDAQIAPQVAGRILNVLVREGDVVTTGQSLLRIDDSGLGDQARGADAARAKVQAELKNAEATLARAQRVFEHGIAAKQEVDDAETRVEVARAAANEAAAVAERAHREVARASVRSPLSGVVVKVFRRPGELVDGTPATPVLEVADPSRLELVADTPAADLVKVQRAQPATVTVSALPGITWNGSVSAKPPAVDRTTGLGTVRVALDLTQGPRPPIGVLGAAHLSVGAEQQVVVIPKQALRAAVGTEAELVICTGAAAKVQKVHPGVVVDQRVAVDGLAPGALVVVDPVLGISDGDPIERIP